VLANNTGRLLCLGLRLINSINSSERILTY